MSKGLSSLVLREPGGTQGWWTRRQRAGGRPAGGAAADGRCPQSQAPGAAGESEET